MLLATDLDGTFLDGSEMHKKRLYHLIRTNPDIRLVYVTGRGLESVIPLLHDPILPSPHFIICDVGSTIVHGDTLKPLELLQSDIELKWPGEFKVRAAMEELGGLEYQQVPQQRRCSYYVNDRKTIELVRQRANEMDCNILFSAGRFLDVLPTGVNKGSSLKMLMQLLKIKDGDVLVAGDTLNDLDMFHCGFPSVVVGNAEQKLLLKTKGLNNVFQARNSGAGGILEGMSHFGFFNSSWEMEEEMVADQESRDESQLVMMYHRFPYEKKLINGKTEFVPPRSPNGILPTLESCFTGGRSGIWIAWEEVNNNGEKLRNRYIDKQKYPNLVASRIGLTREEVRIFYKSFGKEAFWPIIFSFIDKATFNHEHWNHFLRINRMFAEKAAQESDPGAIVWIHDYNLWLVPGFLKPMRPDLRIGFFHHTAFPAANTFNILPWKKEIISSLLQCDYIGFHIPRYVENFIDVVRSLYPVKILAESKCAPRFLTYSTAMGVETMTTRIDTGQKITTLGANPVGVDLPRIIDLLQKDTVQSEILLLENQFSGKTVILSVERLDYVKGPLEKVLAFETLLDEYPEFHGRLILVNICTPPADGMKVYEKIQHDLEHAVGRINAKYSRVDWIPIRLFFRSVPFEEVLAYYDVAEIAWITPLRDGMNLVAKEYIAVQGQKKTSKGVLILSEFAGAAVELHHAVLTNPYDARSLKEGLLYALRIKSEEREMRMKRLYEKIEFYDINFWAEEFLQKLSSARGETPGADREDPENDLVLDKINIREF